MKPEFLAWLIGVNASDIEAYGDIADWPTHWVARAHHRMSALGVSSQSEALALFLCHQS